MLFSPIYKDIYYQPKEAIAEKIHVFQQGNHLIERFSAESSLASALSLSSAESSLASALSLSSAESSLSSFSSAVSALSPQVQSLHEAAWQSARQKTQQNADQHTQQNADPPFCIGELGFGSGLNFFLTAMNFLGHSRREQDLHYYACERHPLHKKTIAYMHTEWNLKSCALAANQKRIFAMLLEEFLHETPWPLQQENVCLQSCFQFCMDTGLKNKLDTGLKNKLRNKLDTGLGKRIWLHLFFGDAKDFAPAILNPHTKIDAWFLDGFDPTKNPAMWRPSIFDQLAKHSYQKTTLATYSVARSVRDALQTAGFCVQKNAGFGNKKHMLQGWLAPAPHQHQHNLAARSAANAASPSESDSTSTI